MSRLTPMENVKQNNNQDITHKVQQLQEVVAREVRHRKKWELDETDKYCKFVQINKQTLQFQEKKQKQRIYNRMSEFIGTRSTHQCRSHHQKVIKRYNSIDQFIKNFKQKKEANIIWKNGQNGANQIVKIQQEQNEEQNKEKLRGIAKIPQVQQGKYNLLQSSKLKKQYIKQKSLLKQKRKQETRQKTKKQYQDQDHLLAGYEYYPPIFTNLSQPNKKPIDNIGHISEKLWEQNIGEDRTIQKNQPIIRKTIILNRNNNEFTSKYETIRNINNIDIRNDNLGSERLNQVGRVDFRNILDFDISNPMNNLGNRLDNCNSLGSRDRNNRNFINYDENQIKKFAQNPSSLLPYATNICQSILYNRNSHIINPLIDMQLVQLTQDTIKIKWKQQTYYNIWVQCVKMEEEPDSSSYLPNLQYQQYEIQRNIHFNQQKSNNILLASHQQQLSLFPYYNRDQYLLIKGGYFYGPPMNDQSLNDRNYAADQSSQFNDYQKNEHENPFLPFEIEVERRQKKLKDFKAFLQQIKSNDQNIKIELQRNKSHQFPLINQANSIEHINKFENNKMVDEQIQRQMQLSNHLNVQVSKQSLKQPKRINQDILRFNADSQKNTNFDEKQKNLKLIRNDTQNTNYLGQQMKNNLQKQKELYLKSQGNLNFQTKFTNYRQKDNFSKIQRTRQAMNQQQDQHVRQISVNFPANPCAQNKQTQKKQTKPIETK